jgi:hypothetical protein
MRWRAKWSHVAIALAVIAALAIASPVFGLSQNIKRAIKKEVSNQIADATGPAGPPGPPGAAGRSALEALHSGETIRGVWALKGNAQSEITGITFPVPAPLPVDSAHTVVAGNDTESGDGCTGSPAAPVAAPGFTCIYAQTAFGTNAAWGLGARRPEGGGPSDTGDGSQYGFEVLVTGVALWIANGTWAYTAP